MADRKLVVGLGNPGDSYRGTRHNLGFEVVDRLARRHAIAIRTKKFRAVFGNGNIGGTPVLLSKPQTYMNRSGQSVGVMAGWHRIPPASVVVVHDDLDLEVGRLKLKSGGGHGGHNGLRDIQTALGGPDFQRVRIGIGHPEGAVGATDHVLTRFRPDEKEAVERAVARAADAVEMILDQGIEASMNTYNTRS
jgi:peptidyl-tRNA hydrolase, PTH1 family